MPVSAHECAASATIDAAPVSAAAIVFAIAMSRFAPSATSTVSIDAGAASSAAATALSGRVGMSTRYSSGVSSSETSPSR